MPITFSRSRAPNGNGTQLKSPSPHPAGSPHPQVQHPEGPPGWGGEDSSVVIPDGPYGHSVEDLTAVHRTKLGHAYVKVEEIRDIRGARWVPHRKVVKPTDRSLFIARIRTIHEDDLDTVFCVVEFKNEILADTVRDLVQDMESLAGSTPTARVQALFPYLPTFRARAIELETRAQRQSIPNGRELDDEELAAMKLEYEYFGSLLEFLEEEYAPWQKKLDSLRAQGMIVFELVWALFQPGMKVRVPHGSSGEYTAARIIRGEQVEHLNERVSRNSIPQIWGPFRLHGETVDWKENKYTHTPWKFEISRFKGPRMISALRVVELTVKEMVEFQERGQRFAFFAKERHVELHGNLISGSTRISAPGRAVIDDIPQNELSDKDGPPGYSPPQSGRSTPNPDRKDKANARVAAAEEELYLLPPAVPGFSLSLKKWGIMLVKDLDSVHYSKEAWDHLVIDEDTKKLIRSLVEIRGNKDKTAELASDWIQGKSEGLVFLLHGDPGLGKTLTAETVAETLKRPLYMVGASELGINPHEVEEGLRRVLDRAKSWNAVLLIDEADVLLEKRSSNDLARNALVAAALRLLEYHTGVLFLTTNRVQSFDPASLSRISVAIKYTALDHKRRLHIWRQFLLAAKAFPSTEEVGADVPREHYLSEEDVLGLAEYDLNGRVIKNVVRTAQALALSADKPLGMEHLNMVISVTEKFLKEISEHSFKEGTGR